MDKHQNAALRDSEPGSDAAPQSSRRDMRAQVITVASDLFAERGYSATSVREVVERAGCTKPTLYYYFGNKERLFIEVLREQTGAFTAVVEAELAKPGSVRDRFRRALEAMCAYLAANPTTHRLLMTADKHPDHEQPPFDFESVRRRHLETCIELLREGIASGEMRQDIDVDEAAVAFFGMVDHRLALMLQGRPLPDRYADLALDLFFRGVQR